MKSGNFHFLGVGGIGMSALAHVLIEQGISVSGSDRVDTPTLEKIGVKRCAVPPIGSTVVYSSAIPPDHPTLAQAKKDNHPILHRSELIQPLLAQKKGLLVAGTHGKTSTSSLLSWVLLSAGYHPSFAVGGILRNVQKNGGYGSGDLFVLEADESDGSFLNYTGEGAIITNIEKEHLTFWKTTAKIVEGFQIFLSRINNPDLLFWWGDDPLLREMMPPGTSYGKNGSLRLLSYEQRREETIFSAEFEGKVYRDIHLPLMGEKLTLNALAVFGMARRLGISELAIRKAFSLFTGVKRRQEKIGEAKGVTIYDDYAHHPTEVKSLLQSLRSKKGAGRLIALFQPHRYSRTKELFHDFGEAFDAADLSIITSIYPAGEAPIVGITSRTFFDQIKGGKTLFYEREELLHHLPKILRSGDTLVTMGAGDITTLGPKILQELACATSGH